MVLPSVLKGRHIDKSEDLFDGETLKETRIMKFYFLRRKFRHA